MVDTKDHIPDDESHISFDDEDTFDPRLIAANTSKHINEMTRYLNTPAFIKPSQTPEWTISDRKQRGIVYKLEPDEAKRFLGLLDVARIHGYKGSFAERQGDDSGIMLDFDIYQDIPEDQISSKIQILCTSIANLMKTLFIIPPNDAFYMVVLRKKSIKFMVSEGCYKDGFHLLFPGFKTKKSHRHLLMTKIWAGSLIENAFAGVVPTSKPIKGKPFKHADFMDTPSYYVPSYFYGCITKPSGEPYKIMSVVRWVHTCGFLTAIDENVSQLEGKYNLTLEFSLNYEGKLIPKKTYALSEQFVGEVVEKKQDDETQRMFSDMSLNAINDGRILELKQHIDCMSQERASNYESWRNVIFALASDGTASYRSLAHYFSMKGVNYNAAAVDSLWNSCFNSQTKGFHLRSIYYWAKMDNPEAVERLVGSSTRSLIYDNCYDPIYQGDFEDSHFAEIIKKYLPQKYVTDYPEGETKLCWYEFMTEDEAPTPGQANKWFRHKQKPNSLSMFISKVLPNVFREAFKMIKEKSENIADDNHKSYFKTIFRNLVKSIKKLGGHTTKAKIIDECSSHYMKLGWSLKLDADTRVRGVRNGVLKLADGAGSKPVLYTGFHSFIVSRYVDVDYIPFDPSDELTKEILIALRCYFLDSEHDSFEFVMYYLATTLDGDPKDSIFMIMVGKGANGKSTLLSLHTGALGDYSKKLNMSLLTSHRPNTGSATPELAALKDATLAYFSESDQFEKINTAIMKELTGGENMYARKLFQEAMNFKPKCHYVVMTNHEFEIPTSDYGTWRRIYYVPLKIRFDDLENKENKNVDTKYVRQINRNILHTWPKRPDVLGRYLGILVYYHWKLQKNYGGKLLSVPHPHIKFESKKYQNSQNMVDKFLQARYVKCIDENVENDLDAEAKKFVSWIKADCKRDVPLRGAVEFLKNSVVLENLRETSRGCKLVGHRFLDEGEYKIAPGEKFAIDNVCSYVIPEDNFGIPNMTPEQYYTNICAEYEKNKKYFENPHTVEEELRPVPPEFYEENYNFTTKKLDEPTQIYMTDAELEKKNKIKTYYERTDASSLIDNIEYTDENYEEILRYNASRVDSYNFENFELNF